VCIRSDDLAGISKQMWQSVIGAALNGHHMARVGVGSEPEHTSNILCLAKKYKSSRQILSAVADYLDSIYGYVIVSNGTFQLSRAI